MMVEALSDVARHFYVLFLVLSHRHFGGLEHEDIGSHQYRVAVERHRNPLVGVAIAAVDVCLHAGFIRVSAVHQPFGRNTVQNPRQLEYFGDVGLPIEKGMLGIEPEREPRGGDLECRPADLIRVLILGE